MQENSPSEVSATSSEDLKNFALRVAQVKDEDLIQEHDFEMFKAVKFITLDLDFLGSINVLPPRHWRVIKTFCSSIHELLTWLSDAEKWVNLEKSKLASLMKFDCLFSMRPSLEFKMAFLQHLCRIHEFKVKSSLLKRLAICIEFTEDSLSFNFLDDYFLLDEVPYRFLAKILEFFHNYQLKALSIRYLCSGWQGRYEILQLIDSNSSSLVSLDFFSVELKYDNTKHEGLSIHLPNLQRFSVRRIRNFQIFDFLTIGMKITWFDVPISFLYPKVDDNVISFRMRNEQNINSERLLELFKVLPNLECLIFAKHLIDSTDKMKSALKSLVSLKKVVIEVDEKLEDYIGSKVVESLEFSQKKAPFANWNFISSLERLTKLTIGVDFKPEEAFFEFLKLDRLELLSIQNRLFVGEAHKKFFQTMKPLKNLKTLNLRLRYVREAVLSESIETLSLWWWDRYSNYPPKSYDNDDFIRGPGVKYLYMEYEEYTREVGSEVRDYSFLPTIHLWEYFPKLERVKAAFLSDCREYEDYKLVDEDEPLCKDIW